MRVRIIFRGLTLFEFEKGSTKNATGGQNMGELTAWLVSDPDMAGMPLHEHKAHLGILGRDVPGGTGRAQPKRDVPDELTLSLMGHVLDPGVTVAQSFLDYVPRLGDLHWAKPTTPTKSFITKKIVIPSGRIRAREFISWDWHGNTPAKVAFMDTSFQGYAANEVVVDIGDDSDPNGQDKKKYLMMKHGSAREQLWSYTSGPQWDDDIEPNTVELLFTNLTARRGTSVFWGVHLMTLFDFAGYPRRTAYADGTQYGAFQQAALAYDASEWVSDRNMMGIGQPFPFLMVDSDTDKLAAIRDVKEPYIIPGPPPHPAGQQNDNASPGAARRPGKRGKTGRAGKTGKAGRTRKAGKSGKGGTGGMRGMRGMLGHPGNDPVNVTICPLGRE
jgi:hypothetical protein